LEIVRCIEAGHIFKLGRKYANAMGVSVLDADGRSQVPTMGSYGIGIGRAVAAVAENHHDDAGLIWPVSVAPYQVLVTVLDIDDEACMEVVSHLEVSLREAGIDVLVDDRKARPGVKFADAELIGIPYRVTVGARGLAKDEVEFTPRSTGETRMVARHALLEVVLGVLQSAN
jgi:prolyl-tRNA synthetase